MRRKVATLACLVTLVAVNWAAGPVEASCASSTIYVATPPLVFGKAITVAWRIAPACDVIETGLLLGPDPTSLAPVGEVFNGFREFYVQRIPVAESAQLWIAARARDEDGRVIQSAPQSVQILVPPSGLDDPADSTTPLSFTGTDADFLQPCFFCLASLRKVTLTEVGIFAVNSVPGGLDGARLVASPHPTEVRDELGITLGGFTFPPDAPSLDRAIARWNEIWASGEIGQFPRTGLYIVECRISTPVPIIVSPASCNNVTPRFVEYREEVSDFISGGFALRFTRSTRSTLVYFIPKAPPGSQLLDARLFLEVRAAGDFSTLRLNGKPPIFTQVELCGNLACDLFALWDFTDEVRALAAQGGGELSLRIDPIKPLVFQGPGGSFSFAFVAFAPAVNYPWAQGSVRNSLQIAYGVPACTPLKLQAMPPSVRPQLPPPPGTTFTDAVRSAPTKSSIEAQVCVPGSSSTNVEVKFEVRPPSPGSADAGGHNHDGFRQQCTGTFTQPRAGTALGGCLVDKNAPGGGTPLQASCMATLDAQGKGSCTVTYFPFFVGGTETIAACISRPCAPGSADAQVPIRVEVPGLQNPAQAFQNLAFKDRPFLLTGQTTTHPDNHWGTTDTITAIRKIALAYYTLSGGTTSGATLGMNDMSLRQGGLFDICGTWNPADICPPLTREKPPGGHQSHRTGTSVDINQRACRDPGLQLLCGPNMRSGPTVLVNRGLVEGLCEDQRGSLAKEATIHCELPQ